MTKVLESQGGIGRSCPLSFENTHLHQIINKKNFHKTSAWFIDKEDKIFVTFFVLTAKQSTYKHLQHYETISKHFFSMTINLAHNTL